MTDEHRKIFQGASNKRRIKDNRHTERFTAAPDQIEESDEEFEKDEKFYEIPSSIDRNQKPDSNQELMDDSIHS